MDTFNISIIDDDKNALISLQNNCESYFKKINIPFRIQTYDNPQLFLKESFYKLDLVLLDIEMPNINGIELATKVREMNKTCFICFVTNYTDYLYQSYDVHAFDYILKPATKDKISALLDEVLKYKEQKKPDSAKLYFNSTTGKIVLNQNDIYYFEYYDKLNNLFNRVTKVYTTSGDFILKEKISDIANLLPTTDFVVPHKSFIINMNQIKQMKQTEIIMQNNISIPLSQKRSADIRKKFNDYLKSLR